jgi:hypothetical protein
MSIGFARLPSASHAEDRGFGSIVRSRIHAGIDALRAVGMARNLAQTKGWRWLVHEKSTPPGGRPSWRF